MAKGKLFGFLAGLFLGVTALICAPKTADAVQFRGFLHPSVDGVSGTHVPIKIYSHNQTGAYSDTLYIDTTSTTGKYTRDYTFNTNNPTANDSLFSEVDTLIGGGHYTVKNKLIIAAGMNTFLESCLDNPNKGIKAFTWNIDEFKDTTNFTNTSITPLFWLKKNPNQKVTAELDTLSTGLTAHPHYFDSWGNFEKQDSTWTQGDSAGVLFQKNSTNKVFPDTIPYSFFTFGMDTTMGDAQLVKDTLKFPTNISIKDWNIDSLFTTTAVGDSVQPKAHIKNDRASLTQYNFPDSAKFYLTITGPGVSYSDSLVKRLDSGGNDTITFKKCYKGDGSCTLRCSTSTFADATPSNNVKQWTTSGAMAVEMSYFGAMPYGNGIKLNWETQSSIDSYLWEILRGQKNDSLNYDLIATQPGDGNSNQPKHWYYDDTCAKGINYYKLAEVDFSGLRTFYGPFSATARLAGALKEGKFKTYPNPTRDLRNVKIDKAGKYSAYNISGQKVGTLEYNVNGTTVPQFSSPTASGIYLLRQEETGETEKVHVVK